ncbi:MAG TPA: TonB-dependent receptor, partial [Vicinamibacterales bacterium]|nr:TonB-dependent receptor [Vicinamibacterales bacterium]
AVRFEDFEDFGSTTNWKLTGRYQFNDELALRGAVSTGFRAPTPGQSNATQVVTSFIDGQLRDSATLSPTHPISQRFGGRQLQPEESTNASLGLVWNSGPWLATVDYYRIEVEDRIALTGDFEITDADRTALVASGVADALSYERVRFFINDFDTTTQGVDVVVSYDTDHFGGQTTYSLAANWTKTEVDKFTPAYFTETRVQILEETVPNTKGIFSINHERDNWRGNVRFGYYGSYYEDHADSGALLPEDDGLPIYDDSAVIVDAEIGYKWDMGLYVNVGAQNLFDKYPTKNPWADVLGAQYPAHSPYGFNGGLYYVRVGYTF